MIIFLVIPIIRSYIWIFWLLRLHPQTPAYRIINNMAITNWKNNQCNCKFSGTSYMSPYFYEVKVEFSTMKSCSQLFMECWNIKNAGKTLRAKRAGHRKGINWSGWKWKIIWIWEYRGKQPHIQTYEATDTSSCLLFK